MELLDAYIRGRVKNGTDFKEMIDGFLAVHSQEFRYTPNTIGDRLTMTQKLKDLLDKNFMTYLPPYHFFDVVCYGENSTMINIMWSIIDSRGIYVSPDEQFGRE